jgi:hypothetical protein
VLLDIPGPEVLLFGGYDAPYDAPGSEGWLHDLWSYRPKGGWSPVVAACDLEVCQGSIPDAELPVVGPPDPARTLAFDVDSGRVVLVGREGTLTYDPATRVWEDTGAGGFTDIVGAGVAYDAGSDTIVRFGGLDLDIGRFSDETWAYDLESNTWTDMRPKRSPPPGNYHAIAYDSQSDRIILFHGGGDGYVQQTWAYDYDTNTWTRMSPAVSPPARSYASMAYDPVTDRMILYAGDGTEDFWTANLDDTWAYDYERDAWTPVAGPGPGARAWHAMAYDEDAGVIVLFGGGPDRRELQADTWIFDPRTDTWAQVT